MALNQWLLRTGTLAWIAEWSSQFLVTSSQSFYMWSHPKSPSYGAIFECIRAGTTPIHGRQDISVWEFGFVVRCLQPLSLTTLISQRRSTMNLSDSNQLFFPPADEPTSSPISESLQFEVRWRNKTPPLLFLLTLQSTTTFFSLGLICRRISGMK